MKLRHAAALALVGWKAAFRMEDERILAALGQVHDDVRELIRVVGANYEGAKKQNAQMKRLYLIVIGAAFIAMFFYPWLSNRLK